MLCVYYLVCITKYLKNNKSGLYVRIGHSIVRVPLLVIAELDLF